MRWHDFKIISYLTNKKSTIALKKKNDLLFTASSTGSTAQCGFTFYIGTKYAIVRIVKTSKKQYASLKMEGEPLIILHSKTKEQFKYFMKTDFNGYKI